MFPRTCAIRPFQISAFTLRPHGDCPSLKFHFRSAKLVVVTRHLVDGSDWIWQGGTKAVAIDKINTNNTSERGETRDIFLITMKKRM
jgi:hypothetical protein